jgi:uncharacterized phage-associated protein
MISSTCKKGTQAINYFAHKKGGQINKMKAVKLIYLADRYHLRKYGRPIVGDRYWAMKLGPVGSQVLDIANISPDLNKECLKYVKEYISNGDEKNETVITRGDVDLDVFSQSDIDALETIYKEFGDKDQFELARLTHEYPEWAKFKKDILVDGKKRMKMEYKDFFSVKQVPSDILRIPEEHLKIVKDIFEENEETMELLS